MCIRDRYYRENSLMVRPDLSAVAEARVRGMVSLRDCVRELIALQMDPATPDSAIRDPVSYTHLDVYKRQALTAAWEQKLREVEQGALDGEAFLTDITDMVRELASSEHPVRDVHMLFADNRRAVGVCPRCGASVVENAKGFVCTARGCGFALWKKDRFFVAMRKELTASVAAALLKDCLLYTSRCV